MNKRSTGNKKIVWLASYPKSGNTWFRAFITALLDPRNAPPDINSLYPSTIASSRQLFDEMAGISSADLLQEEIDILRPQVYRQDAAESEGIVFHKVHDAYIVLPGGPLIPEDVTLCAVYIIRNPLDVAVSFANHLAKSIDRVIEIMNDPDFAFCSQPNRLVNQLRQRLLTWSGHVKSWTEQSTIPVLVMRYEDMLSDPMNTFQRATGFIGLDKSSAQVKTALDECTFEKLKQQEVLKGFNEKTAQSPSFFRKGESGGWREVLSGGQAETIKRHHGAVMKTFGYI